MEQLHQGKPHMEQEDIYCTLDQGSTESTEALDCPVCLEQYDEGLHTPKMMPCLHTLCASCIANLASDTKKDQQRRAANPFPTSTDIAHRSSPGPNVLQGHLVLRRLGRQGSRTPITRQPDDPLPSPPIASPGSSSTSSTPMIGAPARFAPSAPPLIANRQRGGDSVKRPETSPPQPPKPGVALNPEPEIPKGIVLQCPLCRSNVNTNTLQTNRYVLAHLRDLKRLSQSQLSHYSPTPGTEQPLETSTFALEDFWCEECKHPAENICAYHELTPIANWMETQEAMLESLKMAVDDQLGQHTSYLESLESSVKDIFRSLNKASRFIWNAKKEVQVMKEELENPPVTLATQSPREMAEALVKKMSWLEGAAERASRRDLTGGDKDVLVSLNQEQQRLLLLTYNPDLAVTITVAQGHTRV